MPKVALGSPTCGRRSCEPAPSTPAALRLQAESQQAAADLAATRQEGWVQFGDPPGHPPVVRNRGAAAAPLHSVIGCKRAAAAPLHPSSVARGRRRPLFIRSSVVRGRRLPPLHPVVGCKRAVAAPLHPVVARKRAVAAPLHSVNGCSAPTAAGAARETFCTLASGGGCHFPSGSGAPGAECRGFACHRPPWVRSKSTEAALRDGVTTASGLRRRWRSRGFIEFVQKVSPGSQGGHGPGPPMHGCSDSEPDSSGVAPSPEIDLRAGSRPPIRRSYTAGRPGLRPTPCSAKSVGAAARSRTPSPPGRSRAPGCRCPRPALRGRRCRRR